MARQIIAPANMEEFRKTQQADYRALIIQEAAAGTNDGYIHPHILAAITKREVEQGRMAPDDELRKVGLSGDKVPTPQPTPKGFWSKLRGISMGWRDPSLVKGRSIWSVLVSALGLIGLVWVVAMSVDHTAWRWWVGGIGTIVVLLMPGGLVSLSWLCSPRYRKQWRAYRRGGPFPGGPDAPEQVRGGNTSTDKAMEASPEATEAIVRAVDVAGRLMKMQWELAIRYDHEGRFRDKGRSSFMDASFAFAYGFLESCLQIQRVEFSLQGPLPTAADSAIRIAGCFIWSYFPDVIDTKDNVMSIFTLGQDPRFKHYREAGALAFKRFHDRERLSDNYDLTQEEYLRFNDDFARVLGVR
jgi:hypothetical protein